MKKHGWIKLYRSEMEWLSSLPDLELRVYVFARVYVDWDFVKHKNTAGTFEARLKEMKAAFGIKHSVSTLSGVVNSLIRKGAFSRTSDIRLMRLTNSQVFLAKGKSAEAIIQDYAPTIHTVEYNLQQAEKKKDSIDSLRSDLARKMAMNSGQSAFPRNAKEFKKY